MPPSQSEIKGILRSSSVALVTSLGYLIVDLSLLFGALANDLVGRQVLTTAQETKSAELFIVSLIPTIAQTINNNIHHERLKTIIK